MNESKQLEGPVEKRSASREMFSMMVFERTAEMWIQEGKIWPNSKWEKPQAGSPERSFLLLKETLNNSHVFKNRVYATNFDKDL